MIFGNKKTFFWDLRVETFAKKTKYYQRFLGYTGAWCILKLLFLKMFFKEIK